MHIPPGYALFIPSAFRKAVELPVIGVGRFKDPLQAERALAEGHCDLVGVVRGQIADADFAAKARAGATDDIRLCLSCNQECVGRMGLNRWLGCIENPRTGREAREERLDRDLVVGEGRLERAGEQLRCRDRTTTAHRRDVDRSLQQPQHHRHFCRGVGVHDRDQSSGSGLTCNQQGIKHGKLQAVQAVEGAVDRRARGGPRGELRGILRGGCGEIWTGPEQRHEPVVRPAAQLFGEGACGCRPP